MPKFVTPSDKSNHEWNDAIEPAFDQAFVMNNAAKDDLFCMAKTEFSIQDLLANDPGSAAFVGLLGDPDPAGVTIVSGIITVNWLEATGGFDYVIRMANGTYSTAHVGGLAPVVGDSLFFDSFETYTPVASFGDYYTADLSQHGWTSSGAAAEIVNSGYQGIGSTDPLDLTHWLDTQASPNGIDITHEVLDADGGYAQITLSVSNEVFTGYMTPQSSLAIVWNGTVVDTIVNADFLANNTFQQFTFTVASLTGSNSLQIHDTVDGLNVGFAIDFVGVSNLVCEAPVC